jgi:phosphonopyruvate decarboxylase
MINTELFFKNLIKNNIRFFSGVPDSLLKNICSYITDNTDSKNHIIAANEGNALALGVGYYLASEKLPLIYMQNSGLGNIVNPLLSIADKEVYSIPMLLMIGWRGEPGAKDEPQHKKQGRVTLEMLNAMEIPYKILSESMDDTQAEKAIKEASDYALENNTPYALIVKKNSFSSYKLQQNYIADLPLNREDAIKIIVDNLEDKDVVVSTTGVTSRELFEYRELLKQGHEKDFLTVGGMGHADQIALGIALQKPDRNIFCFDGDGATLMHMGSMPINGNMDCNNFRHVVFNNGAHDSVGGQPTVGYSTNFQRIATASGYDLVLEATTENDVRDCIEKIKKFTGKVFLEVKVKKGFRDNLGRPTTTPIENKQKLIKFIGKKYE